MVKVSRLLVAAAFLVAVVGVQAQRSSDRAKMGGTQRESVPSFMPSLGKAKQGKVAVNGDRTKALNRDALKVGGHTYVPARPFFRKIGGDIEKLGDGYRVKRKGQEFRFRPGSKVYYYDGQQRYFPGAPFVYGGQLYIPGRSIIDVLGGRYYYDDWGYDHYWLGDQNTWMGPGNLDLTWPRNGARFDDDDRVTVRGSATPLRDVRVLVYIQGGGQWGDKLVYSTMLRAGHDGGFDARIPFHGDGVYRIIVQLLNDYGGIEDQEVTVIRWG